MSGLAKFVDMLRSHYADGCTARIGAEYAAAIVADYDALKARAESARCEPVEAGGCAQPVVASAPRDDWRPIETAPKGTMILLADMTAKEARHWAFVGWKHNWNTAGHVETPSALNRRATHWKPLPPPPEAPHGDGR